jgi:hypothetical protein
VRKVSSCCEKVARATIYVCSYAAPSSTRRGSCQHGRVCRFDILIDPVTSNAVLLDTAPPRRPDSLSARERRVREMWSRVPILHSHGRPGSQVLQPHVATTAFPNTVRNWTLIAWPSEETRYRAALRSIVF